MKNNLSITLILLLVLTSCNNKKKSNYLTEHNIYGKVKSIKENCYSVYETFDEIIKRELERNNLSEFEQFENYDFHMLFNISGNLIRKTDYNSDRNLVFDKAYEYREREIHSSKKKYSKNGRIYIADYEYNINSNLISIKEHYENKTSIISTTTLVYDENNKLKSEEFSVDGTVWTLKKYNKKELLDKELRNISIANDVYEKETFNKKTYKYDENDNLIEVLSFNAKNRYNGKTSYQYDDDGNVILLIDYGVLNKDEFLRSYYTYDSNKNILTKKQEYQVDGFENKVYNYEYKYDKKGNWIECNLSKNNEPIHKVIREIEYYI